MKKCILFAVLVCNLLMLQMNANSYGYPSCDPCCEERGFSGLYVGGNLGVAGLELHRRDIDGFLTANSGWSAIDVNFLAGVQLGWDWQCNSSLFGIVADWNWVNHGRRLWDDRNTVSDHFIDNNSSWFTTIRGKAGLTFCDALIYLTAGAAVGRFETRWNDDPDSFRNNNTKWGWTGGLGVEYLIWCNFSLGAEVLYVQFPDRVRTFTSGTGTFDFGHSESLFVGRLILNYRLSSLCCW